MKRTPLKRTGFNRKSTHKQLKRSNIKRTPPKKRSLLLKKPDDLSCKWCGIETGTECYRHAEATAIKMLSGGGIWNGKIPDKYTCWGCLDCDMKYSTKPDRDAPQEIHDKHESDWWTGIKNTWPGIDYD